MHVWLYRLFENGENDELDRGTKTLVVSLFYIALFVAVAMVLLLIIDYFGHSGSTQPYLGTFGDFFGGVLNPILTFATVVGLSITIVLQRIALRASRLQSFETTFFNMMALHNNIVQQLWFNPSTIPNRPELNRFAILALGKLPEPPKEAVGRGAFEAILTALRNTMHGDIDLVQAYRDELQEKHNYVLGHYFRNLYQILRLVQRREGDVLGRAQAREYTAIIRSQLSAHELALLFLNCQNEVVDDGEFRTLLVDYQILEHLPLRYEAATKALSSGYLDVATEYFHYYFGAGKRVKGRSWTVEPTLGAYGSNPDAANYLAEYIRSNNR